MTNKASNGHLRHGRRPGVGRFVATSTLATAVTLFFSDALDPVGEGTAQNLWAAATSSEGQMVTSALLLLTSAVLLIPAAVGIISLAKGRGGRLMRAGAGLLVLGAFGHAMLATLYLIVASMPGAASESTALLASLERVNASANIAIAFPLILSFAVGALLAFIGLRRAGMVPTWILGTMIGAMLIEVVGGADPAAGLVKQGLGVVAFGYLAFNEWRSSGTAQTTTAERGTASAEVSPAL